MMRKCWEMDPNKRPSFKVLYSITSKYIERIAGYLVMEFNPFEVSGGGRVKSAAMDEHEREKKDENGGIDAAVVSQVTPASAQ